MPGPTSRRARHSVSGEGGRPLEPPVLAALIGLTVLGQSLDLTDWLAIAAIVTANAITMAGGDEPTDDRPADSRQADGRQAKSRARREVGPGSGSAAQRQGALG